RVEKFTGDGLDSDTVYSIAGEGNDLWVGRQKGGLTHISLGDRPALVKSYTQKDGLAQNSVFAVHYANDGNIWAGTLSSGVSQLKDGGFRTYTTANGLAANAVAAFAESGDGATIWMATPNGLTSLSNGQWHTATIKDGLPSNDVTSLLMDSSGVLWI